MRRHANFVVVNARHYRELESGNDSALHSVLAHRLDPGTSAFDSGVAHLPRCGRARLRIVRTDRHGRATGTGGGPVGMRRGVLAAERPGHRTQGKRVGRGSTYDGGRDTRRMQNEVARDELPAGRVAEQGEAGAIWRR